MKNINKLAKILIFIIISIFLLFAVTAYSPISRSTNLSSGGGVVIIAVQGTYFNEVKGVSSSEMASLSAVTNILTGSAHVNGFITKGPFKENTKVSVTVLDDNLNVVSKNTNQTRTKGSDSSFDTTIVKDKKQKSSSNMEVNINLLTTLAESRILYLISEEGKTFEQAQKQSEEEILNIFNIKSKDKSSSSKSFDKMNLNNNDDSNAILLAISVILQGNGSTKEMNKLVDEISSDIRNDGILNSENAIYQIRKNNMEVDIAKVKYNLGQYNSKQRTTLAIPNFEDYIDSDGDGIINKYDK